MPRSHAKAIAAARAHVMPLDELPLRSRERIAQEVAGDRPPARWRAYGAAGDPRPMAMIESRGWLEWHWARGRHPGLERPAVPASVRAAVLARDGDICQLCGGFVQTGQLQLDHIKPYSQGGPATLANLQVAHARCNQEKGARVDAQD